MHNPNSDATKLYLQVNEGFIHIHNSDATNLYLLVKEDLIALEQLTSIISSFIYTPGCFTPQGG